MDNMEKYQIYRAMTENLKRAMKAEFYYEAIFIEYAILEDRCASALIHAGVKCHDKDGKEIKLSAKLNKLHDHSAFIVPYVRKRITLELLDRVTEWKRKRDALIHALAKTPYEPDALKEIAEEGQLIARELGNKVKSVNNYYDRLRTVSS